MRARSSSASASASTGRSGRRAGSASIPCRSRWRASSTSPATRRGSHVLAYADKAGATEENALYGTPDEICAGLAALREAGVDYVLLTIAGGREQMRRFARDIMPAFVGAAPAADAAE